MNSVYDVETYGAVADGETLNTKAFQAAIDACTEAGGGTVLCGAGTYRIGSLELKNNVELHLTPGCKLSGSKNVDDLKSFRSEGFKHENSPEGTALYLIGANHANNIAITGKGEINANGVGFYDQNAVRSNGKFLVKPKQRPRIVMMHRCTDVRFEDASFVDSPCWTFWIMQCDRVNIHRIRINGDQRMINNDGLDIDSCKNVTINDCIIKTDDDCIILRAIQSVFDTPAICENVVVSNCLLESTCQCIRISCPSDHIVRDAVFSNLILKSKANGINFDYPNRYLSAGSKGGADVSNISFSNLIIESKNIPLRIDVAEGVELSQFKGINFSDIRIKSDAPCVVNGNLETILEDVVFNNVRIDSSADQAIITSRCKGLEMNNVKLSSNV